MPAKSREYLIKDIQNLSSPLIVETDVRISGHFSGTLYTTKTLYVEKKGSFEGEAHVASAHIKGCFLGNLEVHLQSFFYETSDFKGILDSSTAMIVPGAKLSGEIRIAPK